MVVGMVVERLAVVDGTSEGGMKVEVVVRGRIGEYKAGRLYLRGWPSASPTPNATTIIPTTAFALTADAGVHTGQRSRSASSGGIVEMRNGRSIVPIERVRAAVDLRHGSRAKMPWESGSVRGRISSRSRSQYLITRNRQPGKDRVSML